MTRGLISLAVGGLLLWTAFFLGGHELAHVGQADSSSCPFALIAATVGGAGVQSPLNLLAPLPPEPVYVQEQVLPRVVVLPLQQARAPPVVA